MSVLADLRELLEKATPGDALQIRRYNHGGGRIFAFDNTNHRVLVADLYNEEDRELDWWLRNHAEALLEIAEAAKRVDGWWVLKSIRDGVPMDGETGQSKREARELHDALARLEEVTAA